MSNPELRDHVSEEILETSAESTVDSTSADAQDVVDGTSGEGFFDAQASQEETNSDSSRQSKEDEAKASREAFWRSVSDLLRATWRVGKAGAAYTKGALKRAVNVADDDVQAMAKELPLFALSTAFPHSNVIQRKPAPGIVQRPLVMLHGMGGSAGNVAAIRLWVQLHSPRPIHVFGYAMKSNIDDVAEQFEAWLLEVAETYPEENFDIIAHSMGGIIARKALHNPTLRAKTRRLLTLGSPHRGTLLARWGGNRFVAALRPDSPFVKSINAEAAREVELEEVEIVSFWSRRDVMILPPENATLEGAWNIEMHESTHMSWMVKPRLIARIVDVLDSENVGARINEYREKDARVVGTSTEAVQPA